MRICTFDELCQKEVISCLDCSRLGYIVNLNIRLENAQIISVIVESGGGFLGIFKKKRVNIPWECIKKIGDDLIIADYISQKNEENCEKKGGFFSSLFKK